MILDPQGYLARALRSLGLVGRFDVLFTWKAIGIGRLVYNYLPLLGMCPCGYARRAWTGRSSRPPRISAIPTRAFRQVTLRLSLPGWITGTL